jgi:hypothetical protein
VYISLIFVLCYFILLLVLDPGVMM